VPDIDLQGVMLDKMSEIIMSAGESCLETIQNNEEQEKTAYLHIFKLLTEQEGTPDLRLTGLTLTKSPKCEESLWVSREGMQDFMLKGHAAIKKY
jgi:hypothetical protein